MNLTDRPVVYWAVTYVNMSINFATWHDFMLIVVEMEKGIYIDYGNRSADLDPINNFRWPDYPPQEEIPMAYNVSAIGRGLEPDTALTLTYQRLVIFTTYMVQLADHPWANITVEFSFGLPGQPGTGQEFEDVPVGRGWFAPYNFSGTYEPSEQAPSIMKPQGLQTT